MTVEEMQTKLKQENELLQMEEPPSNQQLAERLQVTNDIVRNLARIVGVLEAQCVADRHHLESVDEAIKSIHVRLSYTRDTREEGGL